MKKASNTPVEILFDALAGIGWACLLLMILFFAGGGSNFIYIDF